MEEEDDEEHLSPPDVLIPLGSMHIKCLEGARITRQHAELQM